jgi:hypothetical protein
MNQLTGSIGRLIYKNPTGARMVVLTFSVMGLCGGFFALFANIEGNTKIPDIYFRIFGLFMIIFYLSIIFMCIIKTLRKTWRNHCDWAYSIFANM